MIDLKLDFCFKYIFTNQCDSDSTYLLKLLVEQTTHFPLKRYIITNPEILKLDANDKTIRYDILIQDQPVSYTHLPLIHLGKGCCLICLYFNLMNR